MFNETDDFNISEFVAEARKWDDLYLNATIHAVRLYEHRREVKRVIRKFLSRKNKGAFKLTNPTSKQIWLRGVADRAVWQ
jgi:hypothetical protein